jgi:hypothetical protein
MKVTTLDTVSYTCADNKCYLVWEFDTAAISYEIYRNNKLIDTVLLKELDEPFMFLRFPRNKHLRNILLKSKMYVDDTVKKFNIYEYKIRPIYENNKYGIYSNIRYVICE